MCGDDGSYKPSNADHSVQANYHFAYSVDDHVTGDVKRHSETRIGNQVHGSYFVLEPGGGQRLVEYTADERGFRPHVQRRYERQVPAPYKNYHVNLNDAKRFYPAQRQGLHTNILPRQYAQPARVSEVQQREFEKLLQRARDGLFSVGNLVGDANSNEGRFDWTVDDRYSRPAIGKTSQRTFHQRPRQRTLPQNVFNAQRTEYPPIRPHVPQRSHVAKEAIYDFDIKRAIPDYVFRSNSGK